MTQRGPTLQDVKHIANERWREVLPALGIRDKPNGAGLILISSPVRKDNNPSFAIRTKNGFVTFVDYGSGEKGDIIGLVALLKRWEYLPKKGVREALRFLQETLGIGEVSPAQLATDRALSRQQQAKIEKDAAEEDARNQKRARAIWIKAPQVWTNEVATHYVRAARGLDFDLLPKGPRGAKRRPDILHFIGAEKHIWHGRSKGDPRNGQVSYWPCIVAPCVDFSGDDGKGIIRAIHRVWIAQDGSDKAPVEPARKCWPGTAGLVIPLWRGESNLSIADANLCGLRETFVLTEGWEDGYSAVLGAPQHRTWAVISLSNLAAIAAVLPACCDSVIVHRQNDWIKPQAVEQFEKAKAALEATGRPVAEVRAIKGKDLNDTLRGEE